MMTMSRPRTVSVIRKSHCTAPCAAICFTCAVKFLEQHPEANLPETIVHDEYLERLRGLADLGVDFCAQMQFTSPADPNLRGAILEKVLPPDGSDRSPYHVRDLGTISLSRPRCGSLPES